MLSLDVTITAASAEGECFMRNMVLVLLGSCGFAVVASAPAQAVGTHYPFCMQGRDHPALSDCTYASYDQCAATASGRFLYCIANPYFAPGLGRPMHHRARPLRPVYPAY